MGKHAIFTLLWFIGLILVYSAMSIKWTIDDKTLPGIGSFTSPYHGFWNNAESTRRPYKDMSLSHPTLTGEVNVVFDERLVPHIFADNENDLCFAQGYIQAMLRLWQMDISSRFNLGRLAEVLGERALETDIETRRKGMVWAAEEALFYYSKDSATLATLNAYTDGVNYYIDQLNPKDYPIEFKLLGYQPAPWTLLHSVSVLKSMARTLTMREYDRENTVLYDVLGADHFNFLFPHAPGQDNPVHPGSFDHITVDTFNEHSADDGMSETSDIPIVVPKDPGVFIPDNHLASNNWAIGPNKSKTGNPILCNDPHLGLSLPSVWFESHMVTPTTNTYGVGFVGQPSIIIGFNEYTAWGFTNGGIDVADWLTLEWKDTSKTEYLYEDNWMAVDFREEIIKVKGQDPFIDKVPYTLWGPVAIESDEGDLVFKWTGHDTQNKEEIAFFLNLSKIQNLEDFRDLAAYFPSLIQNIVFASREGDIAMRSQGYWPFRQNYNGRFISKAASAGVAWSKYIPFEDIPETINPDQGFVSSANQVSTDSGYPYIYWGEFAPYRGRILNRYLTAQDSFDINDMMDLQLSDYSIIAEEALPLMIEYLKTDQLKDSHLEVVDKLKSWNLKYKGSSSEAAFFSMWLDSLSELTFDETTSEIAEPYRRQPSTSTLIQTVQNKDYHHFFDIINTEIIESPQDVVTSAFFAAWSAVEHQYGSFDQLKWTDVLDQELEHLAKIPAFSKNVDVDGNYDALNAMKKGHGPSWRQIVELTPNGPIAKGVYPGGQSGNPGSKYFDNFVEAWENGIYFDLKLYNSHKEIKDALFTVKMKKQ